MLSCCVAGLVILLAMLGTLIDVRAISVNYCDVPRRTTPRNASSFCRISAPFVREPRRHTRPARQLSIETWFSRVISQCATIVNENPTPEKSFKITARDEYLVSIHPRSFVMVWVKSAFLNKYFTFCEPSTDGEYASWHFMNIKCRRFEWVVGKEPVRAWGETRSTAIFLWLVRSFINILIYQNTTPQD